MSAAAGTAMDADAADAGGFESGAVEAIHRCAHAQGNITLPLPDRLPPCDAVCSKCDNAKENWICLKCYAPFCGRWASKHMLLHRDTTGHCVAMSTADLSFWCYACDSYLHHLTIASVFAVYARYHVEKFGFATPLVPTDAELGLTGTATTAVTVAMTDDPAAAAEAEAQRRADAEEHERVALRAADEERAKQRAIAQQRAAEAKAALLRGEDVPPQQRPPGAVAAAAAAAAGPAPAASAPATAAPAHAAGAGAGAGSGRPALTVAVPPTKPAAAAAAAAAGDLTPSTATPVSPADASMLLSPAPSGAASPVSPSSPAAPVPAAASTCAAAGAGAGAAPPTSGGLAELQAAMRHAAATGQPIKFRATTPAQRKAPDAPAETDAERKERDAAFDGGKILGLTEAQVVPGGVIDKVLGVIYGNALGDAFGLATEFMDRDDVKATFGDADIPFPNLHKRNYHSGRWMAGDWTDDTDQLILILETLTEAGAADEKLFAAKLKRWIKTGFPDLGDSGGMGLGATVHAVSDHPKFLSDPHAASRAVFAGARGCAAANGAVMRTAILGCFEFAPADASAAAAAVALERVRANTERIAKVTHWDPRAVASCTVVTHIIASILQGKACATAADAEALIAATHGVSDSAFAIAEYGVTAATNSAMAAALQKQMAADAADFARYRAMTTLSAMALDDGAAIGYTLKCFACALYGLRSRSDFEATLQAVAREGGDADTNGAVCGAMMGARIGYAALPRDWLRALPHKRWLDRKIVAFLGAAGLVPAAQAAAAEREYARLAPFQGHGLEPPTVLDGILSALGVGRGAGAAKPKPKPK